MKTLFLSFEEEGLFYKDENGLKYIKNNSIKNYKIYDLAKAIELINNLKTSNFLTNIVSPIQYKIIIPDENFISELTKRTLQMLLKELKIKNFEFLHLKNLIQEGVYLKISLDHTILIQKLHNDYIFKTFYQHGILWFVADLKFKRRSLLTSEEIARKIITRKLNDKDFNNYLNYIKNKLELKQCKVFSSFLELI
ncbi:MAG: hypothetical protein N2505_00520 [Endomicrobia bacterium]|nr:hypothetical protein [Endomicrobiia bacterium]